MDGSAPIPAPTDDQILDELAALGLALARDLQHAALAAETPDDKARLAAAFHKVARGVRQGIALKQRLARDAQACAGEADRREAEAVERRKARLWPELQRAVWDEYETLEDYEVELVAGYLLDEAARRPGFASGNFATQLDQLMAEVRAELDDPTSPDAAASAGGGPHAERREERVVEGAGPTHHAAIDDRLGTRPAPPDSS